MARDIHVRSFGSVTAIARQTWDGLLPGEAENWDFYAAVEKSPPAGFKLGALAALRDGKIVSAAPVFRTAYRLDTPLQGSLRRWTDTLYARKPGLVSLPVIGLGSPMSDNCALGFAPELGASERVAVFGAMLQRLAVLAHDERCNLLAVKGLDGSAELLQPSLGQHGFTSITGVPLAMLDLPQSSLDQYFASLPTKDASYLRRKMRAAGAIRTEYRSSIEGLEDQIMSLFASTLHHSRVDYGEFQHFGPDYFSHVLHDMRDRAQLMLCWRDRDLVSFQLSLISPELIVTKHIGMQYPAARELNLYFINWLKLIEFAIEHRIPRIEMGATTYATKLLFGARLERRWLHFRFRRRVSNAIFSPLGRWLDFESNDPELKTLGPALENRFGGEGLRRMSMFEG